MRGRERWVSCVIGVLLLSVALIPARAQSAETDSALRVLTVPVGPPLRCRGKDSASVITLWFQLGEATATTREIHAAYDSLGNAQMLIDWRAGGGTLDAVTARFDAAGAVVVGFHRLDSLPSLRHTDGAPKNAQPFPTLTAAEVERARTLAAWLWRHKCHVRH